MSFAFHDPGKLIDGELELILVDQVPARPLDNYVPAYRFHAHKQAPLLVRPYILRMTHYELLLLMTAGMATIAGSVMVIYASMLGGLFHDVLGHLLTKSVMSVPASILFAHLLLPEAPPDHADSEPPRIYGGTMDAITRGTSDGLDIYLGILAMLLVLIAFVALANSAIGLLPDVFGAPLSLERLAGWLFAPMAWCMGIPWSEAPTVGSLIGVKTILNEFIAYLNLAGLPPDALSPRSRLILVYAMCGFANFGSLGIMIGGLATMCPERRDDDVALGLKSIVSGTLTTCLMGAIVGALEGL